MAVLELRFLAGRYHATPWGRNVNEGEPEWPPSPFRLARALLDIWYRRCPDVPAEAVEACLALLAGAPRMAVPPSGRMAVKCYLDQNKADGDRQPVIDAFVSLAKAAPLYMELPEDAPQPALDLLGRLADALHYLGRSESWMAARVLTELPAGVCWNCQPGTGAHVHALLPPGDYHNLPYLPKQSKGRQKKDCSWLQALSLSTAQLQAEGWNRHPLAQVCGYALAVPAMPVHCSAPREDNLCATYALRATPLPPVTHTLPLAERVRMGLMSCHKRLCAGDPARVSPLFSGKNAVGTPLQGHQHAFYWPCDLDGDGKIDHVRVLFRCALKDDERRALEQLRHLWVHGMKLGELVLLHTLPLARMDSATTVVSATPLVFGRHYKPRAGDFAAWCVGEVRRCCAEQGMPEPTAITPVDGCKVRGAAGIPWRDFIRQRKDVPPRPGHGFRLTFATPVRVPFALGSLAHFGLGLFRGEDA